MSTIRYANSSDIGRIYELILAIADHHGLSEFVLTNPDELAASGFGENPNFKVLIAEKDGSIVGYLSYTINYSIWLGRTYMNIDDVFVDASSRGSGIGEALMQYAKQCCTDLGIARIRWEVQNDNHRAVQFYERLGAKYMEKGVFSWDL